ncbi:hypothetical protein GW796_09140 [archaeon]|nr:hypothetical protein [archaeon]NCT58895.1 hypothetical protein [archaeon]
MDIYDHVEKYWDTIDKHSLINFLMITESRHKDFLYILDLCEKDPQINVVLRDLKHYYINKINLRLAVEKRISKENV